MKRSYNILSILLLATVMTGCNTLFPPRKTMTVQSGKSTQVASTTLQQTQEAIDKVMLGEWTVATVNGQEVTGEERPYVIFDSTAINPFLVKFYANNGCNILNGELAVTGNGLMKKAGETLSTMRLCPDAPYELGINMGFETVSSYTIEKDDEGYTLSMLNAEGHPTITLCKSAISFLNGAWEVTRFSDMEAKSEDGIRLVIDIPELKVHGNTGCNVLNGNLFIDPDKKNSLQFHNLATTRRSCPELAREQAFLVALEEVESAVEGKEGSVALLKDAAGKVVIMLKRLDLQR